MAVDRLLTCGAWNFFKVFLSYLSGDSGHPSIHLPPLVWGQVSMAVGLVGYSRLPFFAQQDFPAPPGGSLAIPRPDKTFNPFSVFWVCPGVFSQLVVASCTQEAF